MEERLTYDIPSEFSDEDRWFKIFTKKQAIMIAAAAGVMVMLEKIFDKFGLAFVGIILGAILIIVTAVIVMFRIPEMNYLRGGGQTLDIILFKRLVRKRNRYIYVKGYVVGRSGEISGK